MRAFLGVVGIVVLASTAQAQLVDPGSSIPEIRPFVSAYFPTGDQRDLLKDALLVGGQAGMELNDMFHLLGTFAWTPTKNELMTADNGVNLFQYDLGIELFRTQELGEEWMLRPFIGLGAGGRTYALRDLDADSKSYFAGYGALGTELQLGRLALRLEGRDYISRFEGISGDSDTSTRNDVMLSFGLAFHLR